MVKDNHVYGFSPEDADHLLQNLGRAEGESDRGDTAPALLIAKAPSGGIAARSGSSVSSATCVVQAISAGVISATSISVPVYNLSTTAVGPDAYVVCAWAGGCLIAVWEDC